MSNTSRTIPQESMRAKILQIYGKVGLFPPDSISSLLKEYAVADREERRRNIEGLEVSNQIMAPKLSKEDFLKELRRKK